MKLEYQDGWDSIKHLPTAEKIIKVLGKNHTNTIQFDGDIDYNEPYGLYTYRGKVRVVIAGMDCEFETLTDKEKELVDTRFDSGNWKINKALQ